MSRLRLLLPYLALFALALFVTQPLLNSRFICSDDGPFHINRGVVIENEIRHGRLLSRWQPEMAHGYGYPHFNYYAPLATYILVGLHTLGLIYPAALYTFFILCAWGAGVGAYWLGREWWGDGGGLITGAVYLTAPYLAFNILFRGALAETFGLVWLPIVLFTLHRALSNHHQSASSIRHCRERQLPPLHLDFGVWDVLAPLAFAALVLAHNATALGFAPLAAAYVGMLALHQRDWRKIIRGGGLLALGLALSARFWLPALAERELVQPERLLVPPIFTWYTNFLSLKELLSPPLVEDPLLVNPSPAKALGLLAFGLALLGFAATAYHASRPASHAPRSTFLLPASWFLLALLTYSLLTLSVSRPAWEALPLIAFLQFPWRVLGAASLCAAGLAGASVLWRPQRAGWITGALVAITALGHLGWWYPRYCAPMREADLARTLAYERDTDTIGATAKGEFLPRTVHRFPEDRAIADALINGQAPQYLTGLPVGAQLAVANHYPLDYRAALTLTAPARLTFNQFYFPGWRARLDDQPLAIQPTYDTGLITVLVPAGVHTLSFYFGDTPVRTLSDLITLGAFALFLAAALYLWRSTLPAPRSILSLSHPTERPPLALSILLLGLFLNLLRPLVLNHFPNPLVHTAFDSERGAVHTAQTPLLLDFAGGMRLHGYDISAPTLPADGFTDVALYVSAPQTVPRPYWFAFYILDEQGYLWNDPNAGPPRWHRQPPPTPLWPGSHYAQWVKHLELLPGAPPGQYQLYGEIFDFDTGQIASVLDEAGNAVAPRFPLGALTVTRPPRPFTLTPERPALHGFGPLTLLGYNLNQAEARAGDTLLLTLYWRSETAPGMDYTAHVDLRDPTGAPAFSMDLAPVNAYPTSVWQPGDEWRGQHRLRLPAALADGAYRLTLSLAGTPGAATLGALAVTAPSRTFTRPRVQIENGASLDGVAVLEGHALTREAGALTVSLIWRATGAPEVSYSVFVHLADAAGRVWAQGDSIPADWTRPTTGWLPGEYIADPHTLTLPADLPPGEYKLLVGLYDPQTGQRVPASGPGVLSGNRIQIGAVTFP